MHVVFGDGNLGVKYNETRYLFSYSKHGLISLNKSGCEFIYRPFYPAFWRATTCNDRSNNTSLNSALWMGCDCFSYYDKLTLVVDGVIYEKKDLLAPLNNTLLEKDANELTVSFKYLTPTMPQCEVYITYSLSENTPGLKIRYEYFGKKGLPNLVVCGLRAPLTKLAKTYTYHGLKGETYPDRCSYREEGVYTVAGDKKPLYAKPQEYGMHMMSKRVDITYSDGSSLTILKDKEEFNFSLIPYTPLELESAFHTADLPAPRRSYLTIAAKVKGVGGVNSWGADCDEEFLIDSSGYYHTSFILI